MVRSVLLLLTFIPIFLWAQDVSVTAQIEDKVTEDQPIKGTITITHETTQKVDTESFRMEKKPLTVEFLRTIRISPNLIISIYAFEIKGKPKGLHVLPEVSVTVGGNEYRSISTTFEVEERLEIPVAPTDEMLLKLEAYVEGDDTLFPGQRTKLVYRYLFNTNLDLVKEHLPLLDAEGLRKIGDKQLKEYSKQNMSVFEISQLVEGVNPGTYTYGPSRIEGRPYKVGRFRRKLYAKQTLSAQTPLVTVRVLPFPKKGKPSSFTGAVGSYTFNVRMLTPTQVGVGDKIVLSLKITGEGQLENVQMPDVCCQPGFPGVFRLSDIPPVGKIQNSTKEFQVKMRPLSPSITEIPSIEFSFFDPNKQSYAVLKSDSIPVTVKAIREEKLPLLLIPTLEEEPTPLPPTQPSPVEIIGNYPLNPTDLRNTLFGTWWVLLLIPVGAAVIIYQINWRRFLIKKRAEVVPRKSRDHFEEALQARPESPEFYYQLTHAFLLRLKELGEIKSVDIPPDKLPKTRFAGKVRELLRIIEEQRFAGKEVKFDKRLLRKAEELFRKMQL